MNSIKAKELAEAAHHLQERRGGEPYIKHPARIVENIEHALSFAEFTEKTFLLDDLLSVAWLHDSIEDSWVTPKLLHSYKFSEHVVNALVALTHDRKLHKSYVEYINGVVENPMASIVKIFDIVDNISDDPSERQKEKYTLALLKLTGKF